MTSLANYNLYAEGHEQVILLCAKAREQFTKAMEVGTDLSIFLVEGQLICNEDPLETTFYTERFSAALLLRKISHLRIVSGVTDMELCDLVELLSARGRGREFCSSEHVRFGTAIVEFGTSGAMSDERELIADWPPEGWEVEEDRETTFYREVIVDSGKPGNLPMTKVTGLVTELIDQLHDDLNASLSQIFSSSREERTLSHATTVAILNIAQGMSLGIEDEKLRNLGIAGLLHDIGKVFIPPDLLEKEKMNAAERDLYHQHPVKGALYLLDSPWVPHLAVITALDHHYRYDGSGYPALGPTWQQNLCSMITAISDLYDALTFSKTVLPARIPFVMAAMAGTTIQPGLTRRFLELLARQAQRGH
jgi:hypothetical protein